MIVEMRTWMSNTKPGSTQDKDSQSTTNFIEVIT